MKTLHNLTPGSDAWHAFRLQHGGASEAAAMLGLDPIVKRSELLRMKHTGMAREFSEWLQANVLDKGHAVEAMARPHAEELFGEELYPLVYSDGYPSASTDGIVIDESRGWECKQWSEERAACLRDGRLPEKDAPQVQQEMMVTGASRWLFTVTDGTPERTLNLWVDADPEWHSRLRNGWAQFERDLATYELPPATEAAPVGKTPDSLPALRIEVTGQVTASNLAEFKETALTAIRSVNRSLTTDADFADAEKAVKWCSDVETRLEAAKQHALSQTASIDALFKTIDDIAAEARRVRLDLNKLVTSRKTEVKEHAVAAARKAFDLHVAVINSEIAPMALRAVQVDFAGAIKGLRSISSMQDALDTALAAAKIVADTQGRSIRANVAAFNALALADDYGFLFADLHQLVHKAADDFGAVVRARIAEHKQAEAAKEAKRQADEAARIAQAEQRAREQEAARIAEQQRQAALAAAQQTQQKADEVLQKLPEAVKAGAMELDQAKRISGIVATLAADSAITEAKVRASEPAALNLGAICGRLGFTVSAAFLADVLHVQAAKQDKAALLYTETQFGVICRQIVSHVGAMAELYSGEPA